MPFASIWPACALGAVYLPLNTGYTPSELAYFVGDAEPRVFVCATANLEKIAAALPAAYVSDPG